MKRLSAALAGLAAVGFLSIFGVVGITPANAIEINGETKPINHVSAEECKDCHQDIYKQWKSSMHAQSTAFNDPIHNAFYRKVVGDPGKEGVRKGAKKAEDGTMSGGKYPVCLQCHAPNAARDGKTKLDAMPAYKEGVNCVTCHSLTAYNGIKKPEGGLRLGMLSYDKSSSILQGPGLMGSGGADADAIEGMDDKENPHLAPVKGTYMPIEGRPQQFRSNDACMGCHDKRNNGHGVALCSTGEEYDSKVKCQSCHMSVNDGVADHSMGGGHNMGMLRRSMILSIDAKKNGDTIDAVVNMENLQPHSMPTGAPFRNIFFKVTAMDKDGNVVWENAKGHPGKDDPNAYLHLVLLDGENKPTTPPKAKARGADNRLKPFEKRSLTYSIPAAGVVSVHAEVFYNLLWPSLQKAMKGKVPDELRTPLPFMQAETKL